jgi:hypothetical protein
MKICPVEAELFHSDGQTDGWTHGKQMNMTKLISAFRNFANAPKNIFVFSSVCVSIPKETS